HIGRQALREAVQATDGHQGASGVISCNEFGDCSGLRFNVYQITDPAAGVAGSRENLVFSFLPEDNK
ncbi:MAG: ABC transporter substrate-binding protein, partial [Okeania sp. SIO3B3]|nr:ABC transporter substrate-binding protein [Okeania sp. SIO3B3]